MNFEDLQKTWQAQNAGARISINADLLLREVRRNQRSFAATIFWRDAREVISCGGLAVSFFWWGMKKNDWSLEFLAFCCLAVGVFFLVDRVIQNRKRPAKNDSLQSCLENSLREVRHQIWLLKNIFWWYLLPILIGLSAVSGAVLWHQRHADAASIIGLAAFYVIFYGTVYGFVYWLNQFAVKKNLEPRRQELEALLASLK